MATDVEILGADIAKKAQEEQANIAAANKARDEEAKKKQGVKKKIVIKNTLGEEVSQKDYFYSSKGNDTAPAYFTDVCGYPVDREDMLAVFHKIFRPKDGFLFYKTKEKEVYVIIVPIKHSSIIGADHDSIEGDFQKHAISFISEGSVNLDTLQMKLKKVASTIKIVAD